MNAAPEPEVLSWDDPDRFPRFLTASVPVLLVYIGHDHRFCYANAAYSRWVGRRPEDIIGRSVAEVIGEGAYAVVRPFLEAALLGEEVTFEREAPYGARDDRFIHVTYVPDRDGDGVVRGIAGVVMDITEQRRADEERHQIQEELALVISGARCVLWHAEVSATSEDTLHWETSYADEAAAQRSFGVAVPPGEDFAAAWYQSRVPEDRERSDVDAACYVRAGKDYSHEFRCRRSDGSLLWMHEDVRVQKIAAGRWHLIGVTTDITDRKQAEDERERLLQESREGAVRQQAFLRDVLASVTDSRLRLCGGPEDLPHRLPSLGPPISLSRDGGLGNLRRRTGEAALAQSFSADRGYDLISAVSEAGMNAIVHAGRGSGEVCGDGGQRLQVWIVDQGAGISLEQLPQATLARGYSTASTLGHGMKMMLQLADRIFLLTSPRGTTVVLEQDRDAAPSGWIL